MRDVRMSEPRKDAAFAFEAHFAGASEKRNVEKLYRRAPFETAIAPPGHPDRAHSSLADRRLQRVSANRLASQWGRTGELHDDSLQKSLVTERIVFSEQPLQIRGECRILLSQRFEPRGPLF